MKPLSTLIVTILILSGCSGTSQPTADETTASLTWLALLDGGDYAATWQSSAPLFQAAVTKEDWAQKAAAVREPLGTLVSREPDGADRLTTVPGGPDGEYVVIQYESAFSNKASAVETHTIYRASPDQTWRNAGYFIR